MTDTALEIRGLCKSYRDFQLKNINLTLPSGCIMGLIGENGAGKSTTIKLILNMLHRDSGEILVLGHDNRKGFHTIKEDLGVVLDECFVPETLTAHDLDHILKNVYQRWSRERFSSYLSRFHLPEKKPVKEYSRGMKMKLAIAMALSHHPKLLLLDEATSGLDPIVRDEILDVFFDFIQEEDHAILISSHIISDLEKVCDYIAFLHRGKLVFSKPKDDLLSAYRVVKGSEREIAGIPSSRIHGIRRNSFGTEALVDAASVPPGLIADPADIETVMLYFAKGDSQ